MGANRHISPGNSIHFDNQSLDIFSGTCSCHKSKVARDLLHRKADMDQHGTVESKGEGTLASVWRRSVHKSAEAGPCLSAPDSLLCHTSSDKTVALPMKRIGKLGNARYKARVEVPQSPGQQRLSFRFHATVLRI
jgi:hypothetical protein